MSMVAWGWGEGDLEDGDQGSPAGDFPGGQGPGSS